MQTQKDHVDADRFQALRVADAVTFGHVLHLETRARRAGVGLFVGAIVAVLAVVAVGLFGLLKPGGATSWRAAGSIVVDRDTGARMIYRDGRLHEVRNYASALLAQGPSSHVVQVASASIADVPLGPRVGIAGAPDEVPRTLVSGRWLLCASADAAAGKARMTVLVDEAERASALNDDRFALLRDTAGRRWLIAGDERHRVADALVPLVLGMRTTPETVVPTPWLRALRTGVPIAAPTVPGAGAPGPEVAGTRAIVGTLFTYTAPNGSSETLVAMADGLATVPETEAAIMQAHQLRVRRLTAADVASAPRSTSTIEETLPDLVHSRAVTLDTAPICVRQRADGTTEATLRTVPSTAVAAGTGAAQALGFRLDTAQGVYAAATDATGDAVASVLQSTEHYLITGDGMKYPVMSQAAADALGFSGATPRPVTPALLDALPTGPRLSRAAVGAEDH